MTDVENTPDYEAMSDEEILGIESPAPPEEFSEEPEVQTAAEEVQETLAVPDEEILPEEEIPEAAPVEADSAEEVPVAETAEEEAPEQVLEDDTPHQSEVEETTPSEQEEEEEEKSTIDYQAVYNQVMAPFKANGKEFVPKSPDDVIRLMQMGSNYTKKMQSLAPNLKLMKMLENNGLLQEDKINHLIDLDRKDPAAIQKLLRDGSVDPMDIDVEAPAEYTPGNHSVSDQEMAFSDALNDVMSTSDGQQTVTLINDTWDHASKEIIYQEPNVLKIIDEQRANGVYDRISSEVERQRTLGHLNNIPFIQAYKQVGDVLYPSEAPQPQAATSSPKVLTTRPAKTQNAVVNSEKAKAASPTRSTPPSSPKQFDPFSMTDEQIMAITTPG